MRILFVHRWPDGPPGGAELSLAHHAREAPRGASVAWAAPEEEPDLAEFDGVVLANLRPHGGPGEAAELAPLLSWARRLRSYRGFSLRSERDLHPCAHRDARCVQGPPWRLQGSGCSRTMRDAAELLYHHCRAVHFLSPAHQQVIAQLIEIDAPQHVAAPPLDLERFRTLRPWKERPPQALILGDAIRVAESADELARAAGFEPVRLPYLSVPYEEMPEVYNRFQAVVVAPVMFHAFGRVAAEALACGCRVLANERVGALSWPDPLAACRRGNADFWRIVTRGVHALRRRRVFGLSLLRSAA